MSYGAGSYWRTLLLTETIVFSIDNPSCVRRWFVSQSNPQKTEARNLGVEALDHSSETKDSEAMGKPTTEAARCLGLDFTFPDAVRGVFFSSIKPGRLRTWIKSTSFPSFQSFPLLLS